MDRDSCWARLRGIIEKRCPKDAALTPSSLLFDELGIDSIDMMGIIIDVEKEFGLKIGGQDLAEDWLGTPAKLMDFILARTGPAA
ncbi:MAG: phosphopantetheine-binding protein [Elusimicrobia bacterium]|nr:phosphopantetheine-binding protein [Elusimicrobiota bacterium]